jgi:hypothetical protein
VVMLKSSLRKIFGGHHDLVNRYGVSVSGFFRLTGSDYSFGIFNFSWKLSGTYFSA